MNIKVYNGDTLYKEYSFPYSDRKVVMKNRNNQLIPATESMVYLKRMSGFAYYKLYPNLAQMKQIIELYTLQEAGYELRWVFGGERKVYIVSDFPQKKVGLKSFVDIYELDLTLEIVGNVYIDSDIMFYSEDFDTDVVDCNEFNTIYFPKLTLLDCSTSIRNASVTDSILKIWGANGELAYVKMPLKNYPYGVLDLQILRTKVSVSSGKTVGITISPQTGYNLSLKIQNSGTHWSIGGEIQYPSYYDYETKTIDGYVAGTTEMDLRIQSDDLKVFSLQHKLDGDWEEDFVYEFSDKWGFTENACLKLYTMWGWMKLDKLQFNPNGVYIP